MNDQNFQIMYILKKESKTRVCFMELFRPVTKMPKTLFGGK